MPGDIWGCHTGGAPGSQWVGPGMRLQDCEQRNGLIHRRLYLREALWLLWRGQATGGQGLELGDEKVSAKILASADRTLRAAVVARQVGSGCFRSRTVRVCSQVRCGK